jgi:hypothetical protein
MKATEMKNVISLLVCFALALTLPCMVLAQKPGAEVLKPIQDKYAPDDRMAVFSVELIQRDSLNILKGEVQNPAAKSDVVAALNGAGYRNVVDSIVVLPDPKLGEKVYGIITVSVAQFRAKAAVQAEIVTQALMGSGVRILKARGGWLYVQTLSEDYLGWVEDGHVVEMAKQDMDKWNKESRLFVGASFTYVREKANATAQPVADVVIGCLVLNKGLKGNWYSVELPDGRKGYLEKSSAMDYERWNKSLKPSPANLEKAARQFVGIPYLWGGVSPKGFDCSGFVKTVYMLNGITLLRDADMQGMMGQPVSLDDSLNHLKKGDLVLFGSKATAERKERISHVGMYLGNGEFIHCSGMVKFNSFDYKAANFSENLLKRLVKVKRLLPDAK